MTIVDPSAALRFAAVPDSPDSDLSELPPVSWSSADVRLLKEQLTKYREVLASNWSDDTIYPSFRATKGPDQPASHGQCGVTSAWVLRKLSRAWPQAQYCVGDVLFGEGERDVAEFHCWVEIGHASSTERLVIDLTCDQFEALRDFEVLCEDHGSLMDRSIEYKASSRRRFKELREDSVWGRLKVLKRAMRPTFLKTVRKAMTLGPDRSRRDQGAVESAIGSQSTEASAA